MNVSIHEKTLENGLRVIVCPDHGAPVLTVNVIYKVGSFDEDHTRTGLAHLFEHLMFDNTSTGMDKQYDIMCAKAGGSNNAYTTYDHTTYYITLPSHQIDLGLWLEAERMRSFSITDKALATQRSVVIEEIKQNVMNQPYMRWVFAMQKAAFKAGSGYSWDTYGDPAHVASTTLDDASGFHARFYNPANAVLVIAGDTTPEEAFAKAEEQFGSIPKPEVSPTRSAFTLDDRLYGTHLTEPDSVPSSASYISVHMPGSKTILSLP